MQGRAGSDIGDCAEPAARPDGLVPINPSRFFMSMTNVAPKNLFKTIIFFSKPVEVFWVYKPELISNKKEVVLVDKATADMFTGQQAFDMIGGKDTISYNSF